MTPVANYPDDLGDKLPTCLLRGDEFEDGYTGSQIEIARRKVERGSRGYVKKTHPIRRKIISKCAHGGCFQHCLIGIDPDNLFGIKG